ncbi:MAG: hypothetical protein R3E99_00390 [Burkholderiaceae bacterium]
MDVFKPQTGEIISDGADGIACWFIDTDYNEELRAPRLLLGANDPYSALKTTLEGRGRQGGLWDTLNSDTSRPFDKPNRAGGGEGDQSPGG